MRFRRLFLKKTDFVVRFAGEGGQGFLSAAVGFAGANTQAGYHAQTFATFPSQITGGPTWMQARISTEPILSRGDSLDVLVVFNDYSYETHKDEVREGGVILFDSDQLQLPICVHVVVLVPQNIEALKLGKDAAAASGFSLGELAPPEAPQYEQIFTNGNTALSLGAMQAGVNFYVGYPISPATTVLVWMEENLVGEGKFVYQVSSEIEAINALVGAGYSGAKAMTATAGPGFSLMSEGLGLAWMAEIPCVVVDVQRGGPATGLPTKTEQSDLFAALHPAHGDVSLPVIAPGTVEECFYAAVAAFNWAERYQGPVIVLSEHSLSEREQNFRKPDIESITVENRIVFTGDNEYFRYQDSKMSPMPLPGGPGSYVANASEHDPMGDTTHLPERHIQMTERRFKKLELLEDGAYESQNIDASIALMPWGGSKGSSREAYTQMIEGEIDLAWYFTMYLNPLPKALLEELLTKHLVIVPELNYQGQFSSYLRSKGVKAESITQYTGLPFKVNDLVDRISDRISSGIKEGATT